MFDSLKKRVLKANLDLPRYNLVSFTWGNVSGVDRESKILVIKPSGMQYEDMSYKDMAVVRLEDGTVVEGERYPSSDTETHRMLYQSWPEICGIVHTHSRHATIWAQAGRPIPAWGTTHADDFHGEIPCTRLMKDKEIEENYEINTGKVIVETFTNLSVAPLDIPGVLVHSHGPFVWGNSVESALKKAVVLEEIAYMALLSQQLTTNIPPISKSLLDLHYYRKNGGNAWYGQSR